MATELDSPTLGRGADWGGFYEQEPFQGNDPFSPSAFGQLLFSEPDAAAVIALLGLNPGSGLLTFADIGGTIAFDQFPPGSVVEVDSIDADALYFYDNTDGSPRLIGASDAATFLNLNFDNIGGNLSIEQLPFGTVVSLDSIDEDAFYFFNNTSFEPELLSRAGAIDFLALAFGDIGGTLSLDQLPSGTAATIDTIGEDGLFLWDDSAAAPILISFTDTYTFLGVDTDVTLAADSDTRIPSQKAVKAYADSLVVGGGTWGSITGTLSDQLDLQAALDGKQPVDSDLTSIAGLSTTSYGRDFLTLSDAAAARTYMGVGTGTGDVVGPSSSVDAEIALFNSTTGKLIKRATGSGLVKATSGVYSNITDNSSNWDTAYTDRLKWDGGATGLTAATGRTSLGLGTLATQSGTFSGTSSGTNTGDQDLSGYQPLDSDLTTLAGLTATTDNFIVSVSSAWASRTPSQVRTTLGLVIGTNVQAWDADLDTWAGKTPYAGTLTITTGKTFNVTNNLTLTATDGSTLAIGGGGTLGSAAYTSSGAYQPIDSDLTTIAGLTASTDNFIVSVSSAWASRTPSQVRTTLGLVIGTDVQAWDADLDALAALTGTNTIYYRSAANTWTAVTIGSNLTFSGGTLDAVSSGGVSDTAYDATSWNAVTTVAPSKNAVRDKFETLRIGTDVQAWDADLDTWAGITPAANVGTFLTTPSSANLRSAMTDEIGTGACVFDGATLTLLLTTATCGSSLASLNIPAGTVPSTPNDGDIFADANCLYACTDTGNPGVVSVRHFIRADSTVTQANDANAHAIFTTPTNGRLTLETGTYRFEAMFTWTATSATSGNVTIDFVGAGGASTGAWMWRSVGADNPTDTQANVTGLWSVTKTHTGGIVTGATSTTTNVYIVGTFEVTGAGTIVPTQTLQNAAAAVLSVGSFFMCERIGSTSVTSVGQWD